MPTPDWIEAALAVATFVAGLAIAWWRLTARLHAFLEAQKAASEALGKLRVQVAHTGRKAGERLDLLARDLDLVRTELARQTVMFTAREQDVTRVEGQMEQLSNLLIKQVAAVNQATASLSAIWRTLQVLHPDRVPRRASDGP